MELGLIQEASLSSTAILCNSPCPLRASGGPVGILLRFLVSRLQVGTMALRWVSQGPGCCSCLSCDSLSGSPELRPAGTRPRTLSLWGDGAVQRLPAQALAGPAAAAAHPGSRTFRGVCLCMESSSSPLSSKSLQQPVPRTGSRRKERNLSPSLGTYGPTVLFCMGSRVRGSV